MIPHTTLIRSHLQARSPLALSLTALTTLAALTTATTPALATNPTFTPTFTEVTTQAGLDTQSLTSEGYPGMHSAMTGGISVADFNNDTYPDLFIPSLGIEPNKLYINNQDGTFTDQAKQWGIQNIHMGMGAAAGDINNDTYPDLFVVSLGQPGKGNAQPGQNILYLNSGPDKNGNHTFTNIANQAGVNHTIDIPGGTTPAFGDIDLDGDLDLFVATWRFDPSGNKLFENQFMQTGTPTFIDITNESMSTPDRQAITRGFVPHIVDITGDRYPEILLTADFNTSEIFVNNGPNNGPNKNGRVTFRTTTNKSNINADNNAMGAAIADFNQDGLLDWFQTNIFLKVQAIGNTLYMNTKIDSVGDPIFADQAQPRGVFNVEWGWGTVAGDFDNDQDQDIVATNGWSGWLNIPTRFWKNDGTGNFTDQANQANLDFIINGRGLVSLDHDKDGDLDLIFIDNQGPLRLYQNNLQTQNGTANHLRIRLDTSTHPCLAPNGFGTTIYATINGAINGSEQLHAVHNNASYLGHSETITHIGLANATIVDELKIEWADGSTTTLNNIPANQELTINAHHPTDYNKDGLFNFVDVSAFVNQYLSNDPSADFNNDGLINPTDITAFIEAVSSYCR